MSCYDCDSEANTNPPYANSDDIDVLLNKVCIGNCVGTVPPSTLPTNFCAIAFGGSPDPCCKFLFVQEGSSLWVSTDCSTWYLIGSTDYSEFRIEKLLDEQELETTFPSLIIDNIPQDGDELIIKLRARTHQSAVSSLISVIFNNDIVASNYNGEYVDSGAGATVATGSLPQIIAPMSFDSIGNGIFTTCEFSILNYASATFEKTIAGEGSYFKTTINDYYGFFSHQHWYSTAPITKMEFKGIFAAGTNWEVYLRKNRKILTIT